MSLFCQLTAVVLILAIKGSQRKHWGGGTADVTQREVTLKERVKNGTRFCQKKGS